MQRYPKELLQAASRLASIIGAKEAVICLKDHYKSQIRALTDALSSLSLEGSAHYI